MNPSIFLFILSTILITSQLTGCKFMNVEKKIEEYETNKKLKFAHVNATVETYLRLYSTRRDQESFMMLYADDAQYEDIIGGEFGQGKAYIATKLNWHDPKFSLGNSSITIITDEVIIKNKTAVIKGYFMPFIYDGLKFGPWHFTTWLKFNDENLIVSHTDIINYTPKALFVKSENSNKRIQIPHYLFNRRR